MKDFDNITELFEELKGSFDLKEPQEGHRLRFKEKLDAQAGTSRGRFASSWWKPLSIAASIALLLTASVFWLGPGNSEQQQLAAISPEASQTSYYFNNLVAQQVSELEKLGSPETRPLIEDAMKQLDQLETDYTRLEKDLLNGGNSKFILGAMITNFQTRIDLLQDVMDTIEQINQLKNESNATNTI